LAIVYPGAIDSFSVPTLPEATSLSSAGTSTRDHTQSQQDLGGAIVALETNAAQLSHDHSGGQAGIGVTEATQGSIATNDIQTVVITGSPTGGTFKLTFDSTTTLGIAYNAAASAVQTALQAVVGSGNVTVTGSAGGPYMCVFTGSLADAPQSVMVGNSSSLTPSGGVNVAHSVTGSAGGDEVQVVAISGGPTGGTFTLTFGGFTTGALSYNAAASDVQADLVALTSIGGGNVAVTGAGGGPWTVTLQGSLADTAQPLIVATSSLTGGLFATQKLLQVNTHQSPDTDGSIVSYHHTLGYGATQAAAGNHAHDYEGPSIYDKPLVICTSTTRPTDPSMGMQVYETDTNCVRVWAAFPNNTLLEEVTTGINYTYTFNTANSATSLDATLFDQDYVLGSSPADGAMGASSANDCAWVRGANEDCQCIAQVIKSGASVTASDDQVLTWTTGNVTLQSPGFFDENHGSLPTNDGFLRMSADGNSYVRFSLNGRGAALSYTHSGPSGEALLGSVKADVDPNVTWTAKAIGGTYLLYSNGRQILAVADYHGVVNVGADYRGWGIGMGAGRGEGSQLTPANITSVTIADNLTTTVSIYGTIPIWQLLSVGNVPHIRAEAHFRQMVIHGSKGNVIGYDTVLWDWTFAPFTDFSVSQSDITIQESGHYRIHSSIPWDPDFHGFDQTAIGIAINSQDIGRKSVQFMRGNQYAPGFPQTNELFFSYYLAKGDVVRVWAQHNAPVTCWLWHDDVPPQIFTAWLELEFAGP
jgi:hypothetical protein